MPSLYALGESNVIGEGTERVQLMTPRGPAAYGEGRVKGRTPSRVPEAETHAMTSGIRRESRNQGVPASGADGVD